MSQNQWQIWISKSAGRGMRLSGYLAIELGIADMATVNVMTLWSKWMMRDVCICDCKMDENSLIFNRRRTNAGGKWKRNRQKEETSRESPERRWER